MVMQNTSSIGDSKEVKVVYLSFKKRKKNENVLSLMKAEIQKDKSTISDYIAYIHSDRVEFKSKKTLNRVKIKRLDYADISEIIPDDDTLTIATDCTNPKLLGVCCFVFADYNGYTNFLDSLFAARGWSFESSNNDLSYSQTPSSISDIPSVDCKPDKVAKYNPHRNPPTNQLIETTFVNWNAEKTQQPDPFQPFYSNNQHCCKCTLRAQHKNKHNIPQSTEKVQYEQKASPPSSNQNCLKLHATRCNDHSNSSHEYYKLPYNVESITPTNTISDFASNVDEMIDSSLDVHKAPKTKKKSCSKLKYYQRRLSFDSNDLQNVNVYLGRPEQNKYNPQPIYSPMMTPSSESLELIAQPKCADRYVHNKMVYIKEAPYPRGYRDFDYVKKMTQSYQTPRYAYCESDDFY